MSTELLHNPHAGDILKHSFIDELDMNATQLAHKISVKPKLLYSIINGTEVMNEDIDAKLGRYFGLSQGYFLRIQVSHDKREATRNRRNKVVIRKNNKPHQGIARAGGRLQQQISTT